MRDFRQIGQGDMELRALQPWVTCCHENHVLAGLPVLGHIDDVGVMIPARDRGFEDELVVRSEHFHRDAIILGAAAEGESDWLVLVFLHDGTHPSAQSVVAGGHGLPLRQLAQRHVPARVSNGVHHAREVDDVVRGLAELHYPGTSCRRGALDSGTLWL